MLRQKQRNGTLPLSKSKGGEFGERGGKRRPGWKFLVFILGTICIVLLNHRGEEFEQPNNPNEPRIAELGIAELQEKLDLLQVSVSAIHKDLSNWAKKGSETATLEERKGIEELKGRLELQSLELKETSVLLLPKLFGEPPYVVEVELSKANGIPFGNMKLEMADEEMPYTTLFFLRQVHHKLWDGQNIIRNARHVIQMDPRGPPGSRKRFSDKKLNSVAFQEYNELYPHKQFTLGLAGRPGGPDWYISTIDNTKNHGPGGQKSYNIQAEADPCFGRVIEGFDVIEKIQGLDVKAGGFMMLKEFVDIKSMRIMQGNIVNL